MEFIVTASGRKPFCHSIAPSGSGTPLCPPCHKGKPCDVSAHAGGCPLLRTASPILDYFSTIASHETVTVHYEEEGYAAAFEDTGQRAAFALLVQAMLRSNCPFFSRFAPLLAHYRVNITYEMFMHMVLTTALLRHMAQRPDEPVGNAVHDDVDRLARDIERRLQPLLAEARRRTIKDAAVNALAIMFNLNSLAVDGLEDYQQEVAEALSPPGSLLSRALSVAGVR